MFVMNDGKLLDVEKEPVAPRYGHLKPKNQEAAEKFQAFMEKGEIMPLRVRSKFHGMLQKWIDQREADTPKYRDEVNIRQKYIVIY